MKKTTGILGVALIAMALFFNSNAMKSSSGNLDLTSLLTMNTAEAESGYSCTVTSNCYQGSVSCTGTKCERGTAWVKCDGKRTDC